MPHTYPITLLVEGRDCLVVGGGRIADRKVQSLLRAGALVRCVTAQASEYLTDRAAAGEIRLRVGGASPEDLQGAFLVIIATDDGDLNRRLAAECHRLGIPVNVVDQPALCSFYVPALVERGPIAISISTGGASPALARRIRQKLEQVIGPEYGELATLMGSLRDAVIAALPTQADRAKAWQMVLDSEVLELLAEGKAEEAERRARELLELDD